MSTGGTAYLLAVPMSQPTGNSEAIAVQFDPNYVWQSTFNPLSLSQSSQLWVFSSSGNQLYHFRDQPASTADATTIPVTRQPSATPAFPTADRESPVAPMSPP